MNITQEENCRTGRRRSQGIVFYVHGVVTSIKRGKCETLHLLAKDIPGLRDSNLVENAEHFLTV